MSRIITDDVRVDVNGSTHDPVTQIDPFPITVFPKMYALLYPSTSWDGTKHGLRACATGPRMTKAGNPHKSHFDKAVIGLDQVPAATRERLLAEVEERIRLNAEKFELMQRQLWEAAETLRASLA